MLVFAKSLSGFEELLVEEWIIGLLSIDDNDIDASNPDLSRVEECILYKLLLYSYLEPSLFLLELCNYVFHILFDLILFFNFKSIGSI